MVSSTGILPVVIGMWSLQKLHKCSPWNFFLSVITVIVSEVALYQTKDVPSLDQIVPMEYSGWPASCGFSAPPLVYCAISASEFSSQVIIRGSPKFFITWSNPYCLVVFGLAILLWTKTVIVHAIDAESLPGLFLQRLGIFTEMRPLSGSRWKSWAERASSLVTFFVEAIFIAAMTMDITAFDGFDFAKLIDWNAWSFGQIVAITIWLPVASKYIYWMICELRFSIPGVGFIN